MAIKHIISDEQAKSKTTVSSNKAMVFISHDTRDAEIAEAFSKLLGSVSAGVLKSFRSSDKKGNQGIEYGVDWYPEIMAKMSDASDVVCLLTPYSVDRPWILYEAGVAKGQMETPVHGVALGIPLAEASTGPFAQFQNCDDDVDSIASLVMQLVSRIPNAEPDREIVVNQVEAFKAKVAEIMEAQGRKQEKPKKVDNSSIAKLFEEIKVMYQDLPSRIEDRVGESPSKHRRSRRFHPKMMEEFLHMPGLESEPIGILIFASVIRDDVPWLYEVAIEAYRAVTTGTQKSMEQIRRSLKQLRDFPMRSHLCEELGMMGSKDMHMLMIEGPHILERMVMRCIEHKKLDK